MADDSVVVLSVPPVTDSHENPFVANGELSQKADYILSHSTITRTELHIADPDTIKSTPAAAGSDGAGDQPDQAECVVVTMSTTQSAAPPSPNNRIDDTTVLSTKAVEVEVTKGNASAAQPQHAEEVKLKKRKCCTVL
jgi:hypothetical protein